MQPDQSARKLTCKLLPICFLCASDDVLPRHQSLHLVGPKEGQAEQLIVWGLRCHCFSNCSEQLKAKENKTQASVGRLYA